MTLTERLDRDMRAQLTGHYRPLPAVVPEVMGEVPGPPKPPPPPRVPDIPRIITDATLRRADRIQVQTLEIGDRLYRALEKATKMEKMLGELTAQKAPLDVRQIIAAVHAVTGITAGELLSERRARNIARPRQIVMHLARKHTGMSLPKIGRALGNKDHTTIMHGALKIASLMAEGDVQLALTVARCEAHLGLSTFSTQVSSEHTVNVDKEVIE